MALDRKRLQKKKAKKTAKKKIRKAQKGTESGVMGIAGKMAVSQALRAPIYECWESELLFGTSNQGMGTIIVSRKTQGNDILMSAFLLDVLCLGVKNAYIKLLSEDQYNFGLEKMREEGPIKSIHPSCARKLVEGAVAYARDLGFTPHKDYSAAKRIFGDIEKDACPRSFEYGKDGKPFYIAGPNDSEAFKKNVIKILRSKCGPDGFHFTVPYGDPDSYFE